MTNLVVIVHHLVVKIVRREFNNDRPRREGGFGDRPQRSFDDRPKRDFGDRPAPRREGGFGDRPQRSFDDRPKRNSTLIVHVAKAVSTINHVLTRMMTTAVTV